MQLSGWAVPWTARPSESSTQDLSDILPQLLDGGSSNEEIAIALADIDLFLATTRPDRESLARARSISRRTRSGFRRYPPPPPSPRPRYNFEIAFALCSRLFRPGVFCSASSDSRLAAGNSRVIQKRFIAGLLWFEWRLDGRDRDQRWVFDSDTAAIDNAIRRIAIWFPGEPSLGAGLRHSVASGTRPASTAGTSDLDIAVAN